MRPEAQPVSWDFMPPLGCDQGAPRPTAVPGAASAANAIGAPGAISTPDAASTAGTLLISLDSSAANVSCFEM